MPRRQTNQEWSNIAIDMTDRTAGTGIRNILLLMLLLGWLSSAHAQNISRSPSELWANEKRQTQFDHILQASHVTPFAIDPDHVYTLPELIDLAELHNPDTRVAWQNAVAAS